MKSKPILFSAPMVRAILDGSKTQTRRVAKPQPPKQPEPDCHPNHKQKHPAPYLDAYCGEQKTKKNPRGMGNQWCWWQVDDRQCLPTFRSPYGSPGDQLWVRETFCPIYAQDPHYNNGDPIEYDYAATYKHGDRSGDFMGIQKRWKPSIHMPRAASRITLEITGVRVERLQDISEDDAIAEGVYTDPACPAYDGYRALWESINGAGSWDANPWVWVVEFKRVKS